MARHLLMDIRGKEELCLTLLIKWINKKENGTWT